MTLRKDYENDAWELLEDYFDKIRDSLIKANIKGEEHQRVITDLRGHVQMKADEILARKDIVNYTDVLEIMGELGSPDEIASSYAQDLESVQVVSPKDRYSPDEIITERVTETRKLEESGAPSSGAIPLISTAYSDVKPLKLGSSWYTFLRGCLFTWRVFQVIVFSLPWFVLMHIASEWKDYYYYGDDSILRYWEANEYWTYLSITTLLILGFLYLLFVFAEFTIIRPLVLPRLGNVSNYQRETVMIYRVGLFSTLVLPVALNAFTNIFSIIVSGLLLLVMLGFEKTAATDFTRHATWKLKGGLQTYLDGNVKEGRSFISSFLVATVITYTGLIFILTIFLLAYSPTLVGYIIFSICGLVFAFIVLYLNIWLNRSNERNTFRVFSIEISSIVWAFRWFIAVDLVIAVITTRMYDMLGWFLMVAFYGIPLLFLDRIFSNTVKKYTGLDYSLSLDITSILVSSKILPAATKPVSPPLVSERPEERPVPWKTEPAAIPSEKAQRLTATEPTQAQVPVSSPDHVTYTQSPPAIESHYRKEPLPGKSAETVSYHPDLRESSTFVSYIRDITVLYFKVALVAIFIIFLYFGTNYRVGESALQLAVAFTLLILVISSYQLYNLSNKKEKIRPYYYWLLSFISWAMVFTIPSMIQEYYSYPHHYYVDYWEVLAVTLLLASPFLLIQLATSKKLVFSRGDRNRRIYGARDANNDGKNQELVKAKKPS